MEKMTQKRYPLHSAHLLRHCIPHLLPEASMYEALPTSRSLELIYACTDPANLLSSLQHSPLLSRVITEYRVHRL
jgi:hypothetical protein